MPVIDRNELEQSPLADLHAIASELGLEGFRSMRRPELIAAILEAQGGEDAAAVVEEDREPDEVPSKEALEGPAEEEREEEEEEEEEEESSEDTSEETSEDTSEEALEADEEEPAPARVPAGEEEPEVEEEVSDEEIAAGVLDILSNGSGFLRVAPG